MSFTKQDFKQAHGHCIQNYAGVNKSKVCGCFYCLAIFTPEKIVEWIDEPEHMSGKTALCPFCGIDSVIGSESSFPIKENFLKEMNKHWFGE